MPIPTPQPVWIQIGKEKRINFDGIKMASAPHWESWNVDVVRNQIEEFTHHAQTAAKRTFLFSFYLFHVQKVWGYFRHFDFFFYQKHKQKKRIELVNGRMCLINNRMKLARRVDENIGSRLWRCERIETNRSNNGILNERVVNDECTKKMTECRLQILCVAVQRNQSTSKKTTRCRCKWFDNSLMAAFCVLLTFRDAVYLSLINVSIHKYLCIRQHRIPLYTNILHKIQIIKSNY